jgi:hypothetical protein
VATSRGENKDLILVSTLAEQETKRNEGTLPRLESIEIESGLAIRQALMLTGRTIKRGENER